MVRWGAALLVWVACDAGVGTEQPHKATRADFDKDLGTPLPLHGFAVRTFGRFDYLDLELIDLDAETMRVIADGSSEHVDQTLALAGSDLKSLDDLSDWAWREKPVPVPQEVPHETELREYLDMADGDDAVEVSGDLIGAGHAVRPAASELVRAVSDLARGTLAVRAAAPLPTLTRSLAGSLPTADLPKPLPLHGVVVRRWGLGGDETILVDSDKTTIREVANLMGKPPRDDTYKGDPKQIDQIMQLGLAAWKEDGSEMPTAPDVREDLYVLDGFEGFFTSGHPIAANGKTGRPVAVRAVSAVFHAAR